jgi:hypothetical protein
LTSIGFGVVDIGFGVVEEGEPNSGILHVLKGRRFDDYY